MNTAAKNEECKAGGFSAAQWVLGRAARVPGALLEEEEYASLGAISAQIDSATAFGRRAEMRAQYRKNYVHLDCSRKVKEATLHRAKPIPGPYQVGDMVMFRREQGAEKPGDDWRGPARVIGIDTSDRADSGTVWLQHEAGTVAGALHLLQPPTTSELYAWCIMSPGMRPQLRLSGHSGQTAFHD